MRTGSFFSHTDRRSNMAGAPSQATITIKNGPDAGRVVDLPQAELLIGRIEPAGFVLNDSEVSRTHARLNCQDGGYFLDDLGSVNGTLLNGSRVTGIDKLSDGDEIMIGSKVVLVFHQTQTNPAIISDNTGNARRLQGAQMSSPDATMFDTGGDMSPFLSSVMDVSP